MSTLHGLINFSITTLSICSGFFTLGACTFLYIQHRTRILRLILLFLVSLIIIGIGFWTSSLMNIIGISGKSEIKIVQWMFQVIGVVLNILVLPFLISALLSIPMGRKILIFVWIWDGILIVCSLLFPFLPGTGVILTIVNVQLVLTIAGCLAAVVINLKKLHNRNLRRALIAFLVISGIFCVLLVFDIIISRLPLNSFKGVDNLSLPLYFIALNLGSFFFADRFLNKDPLIRKGILTRSCIDNYGLTRRETEIIEMLVKGMTNQELADKLYISKKTVENHLYSIYQKTAVKNRIHLLQILNTWKSDYR